MINVCQRQVNQITKSLPLGAELLSADIESCKEPSLKKWARSGKRLYFSYSYQGKVFKSSIGTNWSFSYHERKIGEANGTN